MQSSRNIEPIALDHLVLGCANLDDGICALEAATGIRAQRGGAHAGWGTHNALATIGDGLYVELLAPDPAQPPGLPGARPLQGIKGLAPSGWCWSCRDLEGLAVSARQLGLSIEGPRPFERTRPDGVKLQWRLLHVSHPALADVAPFFIDWCETRSPGCQPATGLRLASITVTHPDPAEAGILLAGLGIAVPVQAGPPAVRFGLKGPAGQLDC